MTDLERFKLRAPNMAQQKCPILGQESWNGKEAANALQNRQPGVRGRLIRIVIVTTGETEAKRGHRQ